MAGYILGHASLTRTVIDLEDWTITFRSVGAWRIGQNPKGSSSNYAPSNKKKKSMKKRPTLKLGNWNVRTMTPGLSQDPQDISDTRKTAIINNELKRLNVDIATLQETHLSDLGTPKEKDYTFFWQGKSQEQHREHGVGFAVKNSLLSKVKLGSNGSERLLTLRLNTTESPVTLISVYAPTLSANPDTKDEFHKSLAAILRTIPSTEQLVLLGDFNARVGADYESCFGHFGIGKMNDNGQRLLELCTCHNLCVTNSFFRTKSQHKVSWRHPSSKHWHQLDHILVRRAALENVLHTRSNHSTDYDTDHSLVCCKIRLTPKRFHRSKQERNPRIDVNKMSQPDLVQQFAETFESKYDTHHQDTAPPASATEKWKVLRNTIHRTALATFGKKTSKSHDWFEAKLTEMNPIIEAKRAARAEYKKMPSERNLQLLRSARSKAQRTSRQCTNEYWTELSQTIQTAAALGNIRGMYGGIKTALGPTQNKTAPLKSTSSSAARTPYCNHCINFSVPQDMRDVKIVTLYKNKGERSDSNNYRDMVLSLRQLQEKCREQKQHLYLAFIDLTKAFDLVSRDGLFKALEKIGCPQNCTA
ncbi:craniofacial development protein 2-like [Penaeus chinensis]|uniref:craniofacial development protein 2-like n=1 Tax=Penaeus chinensis TaxID=139456 RepID=UPI001FB5D1D8|nr:craniofacial development protein 2-like [Penaeus chinensis]